MLDIDIVMLILIAALAIGMLSYAVVIQRIWAKLATLPDPQVAFKETTEAFATRLEGTARVIAGAGGEQLKSMLDAQEAREAQLAVLLKQHEATTADTIHKGGRVIATLAEDTEKTLQRLAVALQSLEQLESTLTRATSVQDALLEEGRQWAVRQAAQEADHRAAASDLRAARGDFLLAVQTLASWTSAAEAAVQKTLRAASDQDVAAGRAVQASELLSTITGNHEEALVQTKELLQRLEALETMRKTHVQAEANAVGLAQLATYRQHARDAVAFAEQHDKKARIAGGDGLTNDHKQRLARQFAEKTLQAVGIVPDAELRELLNWEIEAAVRQLRLPKE